MRGADGGCPARDLPRLGKKRRNLPNIGKFRGGPFLDFAKVRQKRAIFAKPWQNGGSPQKPLEWGYGFRKKK
jgi:hypothetical protein